VIGRPASLNLYALAAGLAEPFAGVALRRRARRGKEDAARLGERLGRATRPRPEGPVAWLHGASVGESLSLIPLARSLKARRPDLSIVVTTGTVTSARLMAERLPAGVVHQYAPVDGPAAVARFLDHWRPHAGFFAESELWPNLILAARRRGVRLALVSARMTEASAQGWRRAPSAARTLLGAFEIVMPQDEASAARLAALGAQLGPALNLKRVGEPLPCDPQALEALREAIGARPVVAAVSTHPGEEALIARAFLEAAQAAPNALLLIVPRHPERGEAVAAELAALGIACARRSLGEPPRRDVYIADTLGETGLFLRLADFAVMGGGFAEGVGGHNPLEPARLGLSVLTGPSIFNAQSLFEEMFAEAAAICAADEAALARHMAGLLTYPHIARRMGDAALAYAGRQGAALEAALDRLAPLVAP
jgi:3-deoxy-D-manno-octulosonic-acid transferase